MPQEMLTTLWLSKLPENIRDIVGSGNSSVDDKAVAADKIRDLSSFRVANQVSALSFDERFDLINKQLEVLTVQIRESRSTYRSRSNSRNRPGPRARSPSARREPLVDGLCWYHETFGERARKCVDGCKRASKN